MLLVKGNACWDWHLIECLACFKIEEVLSEETAGFFIWLHMRNCKAKWWEFDFACAKLDPMTMQQKEEFFVPYVAQVNHYPKRWPEDF